MPRPNEPSLADQLHLRRYLDDVGPLSPETLVLCRTPVFDYWPARIMGLSDSLLTVPTFSQYQTIMNVKENHDDFVIVKYFGVDAMALLSIDYVEPHAMAGNGVWRSLSREYRAAMWDNFCPLAGEIHECLPHISLSGSIPGAEESLKKESPQVAEVKRALNKAFKASDDFASARTQEKKKTGEYTLLAGAQVGNSKANGSLPAGSLVWCVLEGEPIWPARVLSMPTNIYEDMKSKANADGEEDCTEPISFFGEDSISNPQTPTFVPLENLFTLSPGEMKQWSRIFKQRTYKLAEMRKDDVKKWDENVWEKWEASCELATECASKGSLAHIHSWISKPHESTPPDMAHLDPSFLCSELISASRAQSADVDKEASARVKVLSEGKGRDHD